MADDGRKYVRAPCAALRDFVRHLMVADFDTTQCDVHIPGTSPLLAFVARGQCLLDDGSVSPAASVSGLSEYARSHVHGAGSRVVVVALQPAAAAALWSRPFDDLGNTSVDMVGASGPVSGLAALQACLEGAASPAACMDHVERFLLARVASAVSMARPDAVVATAVRWIESAQPGATMMQLAQYVGLSPSRLERRFRRATGLPPKAYASLVRMNRALHLHARGETLTAAAHAAGYFDQAHFNRQYRRAMGRPPRDPIATHPL